MKKGSKAASAAPSSTTEQGRRKYDPEETKRNILDIATQEFSAMGLAGARVDAIAERTNTTKRMLYYYFGSKEGLYEAVLEQVYSDIRALEQELQLAEMEPEEMALRARAALPNRDISLGSRQRGIGNPACDGGIFCAR